jgi:uncharacterized membrane protein
VKRRAEKANSKSRATRLIHGHRTFVAQAVFAQALAWQHMDQSIQSALVDNIHLMIASTAFIA